MRIERYFAAALLAAAVSALPGCQGSSSAIGRSAVSVAKASQAESGRSYSLSTRYESQLEEMISREVVALGGKENVPMELNRQVLLNINYFLNDARNFMTTGLSRGSKYIPMMKAIFRQKGLPEDLVYLALIESGFKPQAVSHAAAVGPWQFIAPTGKRYGLTINDWVDERRDPVKSTYAAADYLTALHDMFNSWPLAIAAYNSGEGKIIKGMKNHGIDNFWDMTDGGLLANETKLYVPSFLAATFIAKDPQAYGLQIENQPPDQWDDVVVSGAVSLKDAAKFSGSSVERLQELNPHLKKDSTPPDEVDFVLRVPAGSGAQFAKAYASSGLGRAVASKDGRSADGQPRLSSISHKVKQGESLGLIAKRYGVPVEAIRKNNGLKSDDLKVGQVLTIRSDLPLTAQKKAESGPVMVVEKKTVTPRATDVHIVASGESLGVIAHKYDMSARELADINGLKGTTIKPGQKLKVKPNKSAPWEKSSAATAALAEKPAGDSGASAASGSAAVHVVTAGESLGLIAQKYKLSTKELMALNNLSGPDIKIGQKLKVGPEKAAPPKAAAVSQPPGPAGVHVVTAGESLGVIAEKYKLSTKELMALNNLSGPDIKIGQKLKVGQAVSSTAAPKPAAAPASGQVHTVAEGESLGVIAEKYKLSTKDLMALNNLSDSKIRVGQKLKVGGRPPAAAAGAAAGATYKVVSGDTLLGIANKTKVPVDQLKKLNKMENNSIRVGQVLKLK